MPLRDPAWAKPILPVIFRISSRPQPPAWESAPGPQFRKDCGRRTNLRSGRGLRRGQRFFRNWGSTGETVAGAWGQDEIVNIIGQVGGIGQSVSVGGSGSGALYSSTGGSGAAGTDGSRVYAPRTIYFDASRSVPTGPETVPQHIWQPVVLYLGRSA